MMNTTSGKKNVAIRAPSPSAANTATDGRQQGQNIQSRTGRIGHRQLQRSGEQRAGAMTAIREAADMMSERLINPAVTIRR
ncbi:MAG: hypothetical protein IPK19_16720 [Chloroflexi bacterium]|nr:hypothetical protein [Chloroflexota bacterium]